MAKENHITQVYVMQNWFKSIFLQIYLDIIREKVFIEAKKRKEWKTPERAMFFEENCYIKNDEILHSFELVFKELQIYDLITEDDIKQNLAVLKNALDKNERSIYIEILLATQGYDESKKGIFYFTDDFKYISWSSKDGDSFQKAFRKMIVMIQKEKWDFKHPIHLADHFAFFLILNLLPLKSMYLDIPYATHPLPGIGKSHTHLSITDPGRGHRQSTVFRPDYFLGNYVHVEHLERLGQTREIESYRVPNILDFALLRACIGDLAPVTSYVGRPMHEYAGNYDRLKAAHLASAAISAFFSLGAAEVKLSFDPLTISQGIDYLCRLMTFRWHPRQVISIAFNLNREWIDDRDPEQIKVVKDKKEIGLLGIEVATFAGWDKITWDGASDAYPSVCIMNQIDFETALTLVHKAHEKGLTTYFSGGFKIGHGHIAAGVFTGVDGIGIGGAQVLRLLDEQGREGPFLEENIDIINLERDEAEAHVRGQAALTLACLDRLYYEGSLLLELEPIRQHLFKMMVKVDENELANILETIKKYDLPMQKDYPEEEYELLACKRIVESGKESISFTRAAKANEENARIALAELLTQVENSVNVPKNELRIYYTDVLRRYRSLLNWNPEHGTLRCKFYLLRSKNK